MRRYYLYYKLETKSTGYNQRCYLIEGKVTTEYLGQRNNALIETFPNKNLYNKNI